MVGYSTTALRDLSPALSPSPWPDPLELPPPVKSHTGAGSSAEGAALGPDSRAGLRGPVHKRLFPAASQPAAQLRPAGSISKARRECPGQPPADCSNLVSFPKYGVCVESLGGRGVGNGTGSSGREGAPGVSQRGRLTSPRQRPFKPPTQPAPHPVCPSSDTRAHSRLRVSRNSCKCTHPRAGGEVG